VPLPGDSQSERRPIGIVHCAARIRRPILFICGLVTFSCSEGHVLPVFDGGAVGSGGSPAAGSGGATGSDSATDHADSAGVGGGRMTGDASNADRSTPPAWQPPFPLAAPGWRDSQVPLCDTHQGAPGALGVWADARGVFAVATDACRRVGSDLPSCTEQGVARQGSSLQFNDGTGWRSLLDTSLPSLYGVTGFPSGPALVTGRECAVAIIDVEQKTSTCSLPEAPTGEIPRVFVAGPDVAYGIDTEHLLEYRAGQWTTVATLPEFVTALWASDGFSPDASGSTDFAYFADTFQPYLWQRQSPDVLAALPNAPVASYTAVWAFQRDDVWLGDAAGQLVHYDGATYRVLQAARIGGSIVGLWGAGDQLFFHTRTDFGRVTNGRVEPLITQPASADPSSLSLILGMWGTSPQAVFLAMAGPSGLDGDCNPTFMVWFDGTQFHRF
jgi:hypothetical protein